MTQGHGFRAPIRASERQRRLCARMRAARIAAGVTRRDAAAALGVGTQTLWRYETGRVCPPATVIAVLAALLNVESDAIILDPEDARPTMPKENMLRADQAYEAWRQKIAMRLTKAREAAGLSQYQAAKKCGVTRSFVQRCESGDCCPAVIEVAVLCVAYNVSIQSVVHGS